VARDRVVWRVLILAVLNLLVVLPELMFSSDINVKGNRRLSLS
jgi:hypothetical protein